MYCVNLTYAMHAVSSPSKCTCGFNIVVLIALQFLPSTGSRQKIKKKFEKKNKKPLKIFCPLKKKFEFFVCLKFYRFQNRTYGSPFPRPDSRETLARRRWDADRRSSCKYKHKRTPTNITLVFCAKSHTIERYLRVCVKVAVVDRLDQLLGHLDDFLAARYKKYLFLLFFWKKIKKKMKKKNRYKNSNCHKQQN